MKKNGLNICVFYLCVHKRVYEKVGLSGIISKKNFHRMLGEVYHIPKVLRIIIIKEMVKFKMLKEIDNKNIRVLPIILDPELETNCFYEKAGLIKSCFIRFSPYRYFKLVSPS